MKIPPFGWSLSAVGLSALVLAAPVSAQEQGTNVPATHTVKRGDTLWDIAKSYFNDPYLWPSIYRVNTDQIEDPHWIYPGEILKLPSAQPKIIAEQPAPSAPAPTVFAAPRVQRAAQPNTQTVYPRVSNGDILRSPFVGPEGGPRGSGKVMFNADIPGIDRQRMTTNFQLYDRVIMTPPAGSVAAEHERFIAYTLGDHLEGVGTVVIPTALLEVVRAPRNGEAAVVVVRELYGMLDGGTHVIPVDTTGMGVIGTPVEVRDGKTTLVRAVHMNAVLPSLNYDVIFDLTARDGLRVGDEIEIYRKREKATDEYPAIPEVPIATALVVRVTQFGSTARVTSQTQPAIRVGEGVRVTARMP